MGQKDVISKYILKKIFIDVSTYLFGLQISDIELIETEQQRIEERRADLVAKVKDEEGKPFIIHIEIQNQNQAIMPIRMLRYLTDIQISYPNEEIYQYLLYIGKDKLKMVDNKKSSQLDYQYTLIDMHKLQYDDFIQQDSPDAVVMAILCDFQGLSEKEAVHKLLTRLIALTKNDHVKQNEYFSMLEILATNRNLSLNIKQEIDMLNLEIEQLPSYQIGQERGEKRGEERGKKDGKKIGKQEARIDIAMKLLNVNMNLEQIREVTGLSTEEIEGLTGNF